MVCMSSCCQAPLAWIGRDADRRRRTARPRPPLALVMAVVSYNDQMHAPADRDTSGLIQDA